MIFQMDEKYGVIMPDLQGTRDGLNCYKISSLLNNAEERRENETMDSSPLNMAASSSIVENGTIPMVYTPTYKISKFNNKFK